MFKLVVLLSVLALAAAKPSVWVPVVPAPAVPGVPLDTPDEVSSRIAPYQAKALSGVHHLAKRSVFPVDNSSVVSPVAAVSPVATYSAQFAPYSVVVPEEALSVYPL